MRVQTMAAFIAVALMIPAAFTHADTTPNQPAQGKLSKRFSALEKACSNDITQFCSNINPGQGRIAACLNSVQDQLSMGCKDAWTSAKADVSKQIDKLDVAFRKNCGNDVQKYCSETPQGKGRILSCLDSHDADLSNTCKNFQAKVEKKLEKEMG